MQSLSIENRRESESLLLTARQAARTLNISGRTLWSLTNRGDVPCIRIGRSVRYSTDDLREFIDRQRSKCE